MIVILTTCSQTCILTCGQTERFRALEKKRGFHTFSYVCAGLRKNRAVIYGATSKRSKKRAPETRLIAGYTYSDLANQQP